MKPTKKFVPEAARRGAAYTMAAAAAIGATDADAAVVESGPQDISIAQFNSQNLNLDGDAYADILLKNYVFLGGNYQGAYVNFAPGKVVGFFSGFGYASALGPGSVIDAATTAGGPFQASLAYGGNNPNAQFNSVDRAFIGLAFPINAVTHYGWVRVSIDNTAGTFVINDWAYEDQPGVGITTPVPEPGTLGMLAAGAAGVTALRRRRSAA